MHMPGLAAAPERRHGTAHRVSVWCDRIAQNGLVLRRRDCGVVWSLPGLVHAWACGVSADKGLDVPAELCCVLEHEAVAGIVEKKQLRAGHAAGQEPGVGRPGVLIQGSVGDQRGYPDLSR